MFFYVVILAPLFQAPDSGTIWIDNNEVWMQTGGGPRQLTRDSIPKRLPTLAPDGKRLVYVVDEPSPDIRREPDQEFVLEIDTDGKPLRQIKPKGYVPDRFERLEWLDESRIGAMECGHANCFYWIMDADSGETLQVMVGGFDFVWSHDRRWVARRLVAQRLDPPGDEFDTLKLNETQIYPAPTDADMIAWAFGRKPEHSHTLGPFTWSPNDVWVAFTDSQSVDDVYIVLASPSGVVVRSKLPNLVKIGTEIEWTDDAHLQVMVGAQTLKFVVIGSELQQVPAADVVRVGR